MASKAPSKAQSNAHSTLSARNIPLPTGSVADMDTDSVAPSDSISQIGSRSGRSSHSRHSSSRHSSKFDDPVRPADSVSQVSRASQRTVKASGSQAASKAGSHRGSQVVF